MAQNELTVIRADGATRTLRSIEAGADGSGVHLQAILAPEYVPKEIVAITGGIVRFAVDSDPGATLDPPTAFARYCTLRVYETTSPSTPTKRLYYRQDGVMPNANGTDSRGFLLHGEMMVVCLADFTQFKLIADNTDNGNFECYVEWFNLKAS